MTFDERIEKLLNRAGQTISDLPKAYSYDQMIQANKQVEDYLATLYPEDPIRNEPENFLWYILHLTDIIDRMEWALENVIGERDYMLRQFVSGEVCEVSVGKGHMDENGYYRRCEVCAELSNCYYEIVPDDWRVDND